VLTASSAAAADKHSRLGFALQTDLELGGDDLATVSFTNGDTQNVKAGQGATLAAGGYIRPVAESPFSIRGVVGYKFLTTAATNADIGLTRVVAQLVGDYKLNQNWWVGLGAVHHANTKLNGDGYFQDVAFADSTGVSTELGWRWAALQYTKISYTDELGGSWDASSVGLRVLMKF
jgi:hypothetical protein